MKNKTTMADSYSYVYDQKKHRYGVFIKNKYLGDIDKRGNKTWTATQFIKISKGSFRKVSIHGFISRKAASDYLREISLLEDIWVNA